MLHRPTFTDVLFSLSSCLQEIDAQQCLLLYITADDVLTRGRGRGNSGAVSPVTPTGENNVTIMLGNDVNAITWEDIAPFTRKPFFLIVESDNSAAFKVSSINCVKSNILYSPSETNLGYLWCVCYHQPIHYQYDTRTIKRLEIY
jgi:hypothetical protein